jgi:hypothetical protein
MWPLPDPPPALLTRRLALRPPAAGDEAEFLAAVAASRALHRPWVAPPATAERYRGFVAHSVPPMHQAWLLRRRARRTRSSPGSRCGTRPSPRW